MNKRIIFLLLIFFQYKFFICSDQIAQFHLQLEDEQANFLSQNLHDIESIKIILKSMYNFDQQVRQFFMHNRSNLELIKLLHEMDQFHTQTMKTILQIHYWITISQFGAQADNQAWLLVQHADLDPEFQKNCLSRLKTALEQGETSQQNYAYLYDRVALQSPEFGMQQKYGTQMFICPQGKITLQPYEGTIEELNQQRKKVGLKSVESDMAYLSEIHKK